MPSSRNIKSKISKGETANGWSFKNLSRFPKYMRRNRKTKNIILFSLKFLWIARKFTKRRLSSFWIRLNFRDKINRLTSALIRLFKLRLITTWIVRLVPKKSVKYLIVRYYLKIIPLSLWGQIRLFWITIIEMVVEDQGLLSCLRFLVKKLNQKKEQQIGAKFTTIQLKTCHPK